MKSREIDNGCCINGNGRTKINLVTLNNMTLLNLGWTKTVCGEAWLQHFL